MKSRFLLFLMRLAAAAVLAGTGLAAGAAHAAVTINGKLLDNVNDIMAETGNTLRTFPKSSLAVARWNDNALAGKGSNNFVFDILSVGSDKGTVAATATLADAIGWTQRSGGFHSAVSVGTDADGNHLTVAAAKKAGTEHFQLYSFYPSRDAEGKVTLNVSERDFYSPFLSEDNRTEFTTDSTNKDYITDVASGLFVDGKEYFIITEATTSLEEPDFKNFCYIIIPVDDSYHGLSWTDAFYDNSPGASHDNIADIWTKAAFFSGRVVTGDFDGDGNRDEFAFILSTDDDGYHLKVYKAYNEQQGGAARLQRKQLLNKNFGRREPDWIDGADIAAGDFDGDGKTELAVAMNSRLYYSDYDSYLEVQTFKWNGSTFDSAQTDTRGNNDYRLSQKDNYFAHNYGLLIEAGDLDGDGKDEIITATARSHDYNNPNEDQKAFLNLTAWKCGSGIKPEIVANKYLKDANIYLPSYAYYIKDRYNYIDNWFYRDFTLAVGPFMGKLNGARTCADVALSWAGDGTNTTKRAGPESRSQHVYLFKSVLDGSGQFQKFDDPVTLWEDTEVSGAIGIAAGDFLGESVQIGEPAHMKLEAYKSYAAVLQVPPYHVDAVQAPWSASAPSAPVNFTHLGRTVQHTNSQSGSAAKDTTGTTRTFSEEGWTYGADVETGKGIAKKATRGIGYNISAGYAGGLDDSASETRTEADKSSASFAMDTSLTTSLTDALMYYQTDMHIWRYPVSKPIPDWLFGQLIEAREDFDTTGEANGDVFITYTLCDEPQTVMSESLNSNNYDDYAPSHEEGNLFSYPNSPARGMEGAQRTLGSGLNFTLNVTTAQSVKFTQGGSSSETQSSTSKHTQTNGFHAKASLSGRIRMLFSVGGGGNVSYADTYGTEVGDSSSFTKTWSGTEGITVSAPTGDLGFNTGYVDYTTQMQTYADAAGILNTAFGVNFSDGWLWRRNSREASQSPYVVSADPALVLPGRYNRKMARDAGGSYPIWEFNLDESSATKIRGMTFYNNVTKEYATAALEQGWPYTISVPVYNASFVDAGEVTVEFGYEDENGRTRLASKTVTLKGWNNNDMTEPNKAIVSFDWTPDIAEGDYDFYVVLDPEDAISEVHETWTHETPVGNPLSGPAGNNNGYHPFSVVNTAQTVELAAAGEVSSRDFSLAFVDLEAPDQEPMGLAEFRRYAMNHAGDFRAAGRIQYNGTQTLTNVCVDIMRDMEDGTRRHVANRHIPALRPGKTRTFTFMVAHERMAEGALAVDLACDQGGFLAEGFSGGSDSEAGHPSSSGGCDAGLGAWALLMGFALKGRR